MPISTIGSAGLDQAANVTLCTTSGSVGIGTASPAYKLDVAQTSGDAVARVFANATTTSSRVEITNGNGTTALNYSYLRFINSKTSSQDWRIGTYGDDNLSFVNVTAGTTPMTISTSGTVSIGGTVSTGILNPSRITISGNNGVPAGTGNGQGNVGTYTAYGLTLLGQGSSYDISFLNKTGSFAGYVATGATTITTSSDERLKENNQPITGALDAVCQMRHETGNYKSDPDRTVAFLIAQDVDKLFPYAVEKADPESWGVNYNWIIPLHGAAITELTALVKEQQAIITQLQADVAALKGQA